MNEAFDSLAGRRVILIGGKGGVGKTTVSIAAALHFRDAILFTTDPASNLSDILQGELRMEALDAPSLYRRFLDRNLANFLEIGDRGTYLDKEELRRFFELSLPGADELMAWMRIGELAEENPASTIVVDTAPTGHTLRMLGAAEHFRQFAAALDSMQAKHREMVRQFTRRSVRDAVDAFIADFEAVITELLDRLTAQNVELAAEIATIPEFIRGYGPVKARHLADAKAREAQLLAQWRDPEHAASRPRIPIRAAA